MTIVHEACENFYPFVKNTIKKHFLRRKEKEFGTFRLMTTRIWLKIQQSLPCIYNIEP